MRCEIVRCDACGQEIRPGEPIVRINQGTCGVIAPAYMGVQRTAEFHPACVHVIALGQQPAAACLPRYIDIS